MKAALIAEAKKNGILVEFYADQIKSGGMFNKKIEDCLVVTIPNTKMTISCFASESGKRATLPLQQ